MSQLRETLFILPCSRKKSPCHGVREAGPEITQHLPDDLARQLCDARAKVGKRAALNDSTMAPAWRRYNGYLYKAAKEALCKAVDRKTDVLIKEDPKGSVKVSAELHVIILSGGYGVLLVNEPIGWYDIKLSLKCWPKCLLEDTIAAYTKRHCLKRMRALVAATSSYRLLAQQVDWRAAGVDDAVLLMPKMPKSVRGGAQI